MDAMAVLLGVASGAASGAAWSVMGYLHAVGNAWKAGNLHGEGFDAGRAGTAAALGAVIGAAMAYHGWTWEQAETWAANIGALGLLEHGWKAFRGWWAHRRMWRKG